MAQLPKIRRFLKEDFADQSDWIGKLFMPLNQFLDSVYRALNRGITINENIAGQIRVNLTVTQGRPVRFSYSAPGRPAIVLLGALTPINNAQMPTEHPFVDWIFDSGTIVIRSISGLEAGKSYNANILIFSA